MAADHYAYLYEKAGRPPRKVLTAGHPVAEILEKGGVVVLDEAAPPSERYKLFWSRAALWAWARRPGEKRSLHEVVFGEAPQRLKFDIDAVEERLEEVGAEEARLFAGWATAPEGAGQKMRAVMEGLLRRILEGVSLAWGAAGARATLKDLAVTDSSGEEGGRTKRSYHVVLLPYTVADHGEAKGFTSQLLAGLPPQIRALVDPQVNKSTQNFRLAGSSKLGSSRVKRVTREYDTAEVGETGTLVCPGDSPGALPRAFSDESGAALRAAAYPALAGEALRRLEAAVRERCEAAESHRLDRAEGGVLIYQRTAPGPCALCGRRHDKDNTLMVKVEAAGAAAGGGEEHELRELCRHAPGEGRDLGRIVLGEKHAPFAAGRPAAPAAKPAGKREEAARQRGLEAQLEALRAKARDPHKANATALEALPAARRTVYAEGAMRPFELEETLVVKAQMGLGKTKALRAYLDAHFAAGKGGPPVIRMVTFRRTFSKSMKREAFQDFTLYSEEKGQLTARAHPRLIVQLESLHRLEPPGAGAKVDVLVLDEVESILGQFDSGLHRNFAATFAMFQWMVATARHVVCMDANAGDRTLRTLGRMRPGRPCHFHWNRHRRAAGDRYAFTRSQGDWLAALHAALEGGKKVVVPTNSLKEAEALEAGLRERFPQKAVRLYSSQTPPSVKEEHFGDVHAHWTGLDALIYTPTVSAGISYERAHFDEVFGLFNDASCDVETCRQMLGRVRALAGRAYTLCLTGRGANLPTAPADIERLLRDRRANLYREMLEGAAGQAPALEFSYDPATAEIAYHRSPYYHLWVETRRVTHLSRNNFVARFVDQVADTGAEVAALAPQEKKAALQAAHRGMKREIARQAAQALAAAEDLSAEEAEKVRDALAAQRDVPPGGLLALKKRRLRDAYSWHGQPLGEGFAGAYGKSEALGLYRGLTAITQGTTVAASLRAIQEAEGAAAQHLLGAPPGGDASQAESRDLHRRYTFNQHYHAVRFLFAAGFRGLFDARPVHAERLRGGAEAAIPALVAALPALSEGFRLDAKLAARWRGLPAEASPARRLAAFLDLSNRVTRKMYGVEIHEDKRIGGAYRLRRTAAARRLFEVRPADEGCAESAVPVVFSRLLPVEEASDDRDFFLETAYYGAGGGGDDDDG